MVIQNGKIYIARGEEATFRAKLYMNDGTPFRILAQSAPYENETFYFTVKRNPYRRDDTDQSDYVIRYTLPAYETDNTKIENSLPILSSMTIVKLSNTPTAKTGGGYTPSSSDTAKITTNCLYSFTGSDGVTTYYYRTAPNTSDKTLDVYICDIMFVIPTDDTKNLTEDTYYYALDWVSIVGADKDNGYKNTKKVPLIHPSEFIIGGSIYD